jgi:hypothetical protein
MPLLLVRHVADFAGHGMAAAHHGQLPGIDAGGAGFAGLIDTDHGARIGAAITGQVTAGL